jgi:hypothetical protein
VRRGTFVFERPAYPENRTMSRILALFFALLVAIAGTLMATASHAQEMPEFDIGAKHRARIAKEKAKQAGNQSNNAQGLSSGNGNNGECGSQNIGNIDSNAKPGSGPREVFVFAPNAINLVGSHGCN